MKMFDCIFQYEDQIGWSTTSIFKLLSLKFHYNFDSRK